MRTTINIRSGLLERLKIEARREGVSLTEFVNRVLEAGLEKLSPRPSIPSWTLPSYSMGDPCFNPDKALRYAADLEDDETLRKLHLRK